MQRYIADVGNEIDPRTGSWWYDKIVVIGPRRAGKTFLERAEVGERCTRERTIAKMTAQTGEAAADRWADVVYADPLSFEQHAEFSQILHITKGNSNELVTWPNGSTFEPFAPKENAIHGDDPDLVWITELWWFDLITKRILQNAYRPVWSVKPGQEWLESAGGTSRSMWLKSERMAGREATFDPLSRTAYFEWSIDVGGVSVAELLAMENQQLVDLVVSRHPRRDHGLRPEFLLGELKDPEMSRAEFIRAYGSIDTDDATTSLVPKKAWEARATRQRIPHSDSGVLVGVGVAVDRRQSAVCAAFVQPDGVTVVEVVTSDPGQAWVADYAVAMPGVAAIAVAPRDGKKVITAAEKDGMHVVKYSSYEENAAGADFIARLVEEGRPRDLLVGASAEFERELVQAKQSKSGAIESATGDPVVCLQAAAAAVWAAEHAPEPEQRRGFWLV